MGRTPARAEHVAKERSQSAESGRFDLFRWLPEDIRSEFVAASRPRALAAGAIIYAQDDVATEMYRLVEGTVRLSVLREDGRELTYSMFGAPACFGYSSLIDRRGLPHTATAQGPVKLGVLSLAAFNDLRERHRRFDEALLQALCGHMRMLSIYMGDAALEELPNRIARRLANLTRGSADQSGAVVEMSQSELATMLGASRQSVNKQLRLFEEAGLIRLSYGTVAVLDRAGLKALASS